MSSLSTNQTMSNPLISQQKNVNGIDLIKFLCAILIFMIHIPPFQGATGFARYINFGLQYCLTRVAVPFYFVCSGFFLYGKMPIYDLNTEAIKSYCYKILRLLGTWSILLFMGKTYQLWYLGATVVAVILLSLCFRFHMKFSYICVLAGLLYLVGLLGDSYYGLIAPLENIGIFRYLFKGYNMAFGTTRNGIFMGFIFVLMGAAFSQRKSFIKPLPAAIGFVVSMVCLVFEAYLLKSHNILKGYNMYVFLLPAVYFLFSFAHAIPLQDHVIYRHLRRIGMLVYFLHLLVGELVYLVVTALYKLWGIAIQSYMLVFLLILTLTLLIAVLAEWLSGKRRFKWINWLLG